MEKLCLLKGYRTVNIKHQKWAVEILSHFVSHIINLSLILPFKLENREFLLTAQIYLNDQRLEKCPISQVCQWLYIGEGVLPPSLYFYLLWRKVTSIEMHSGFCFNSFSPSSLLLSCSISLVNAGVSFF